MRKTRRGRALALLGVLLWALAYGAASVAPAIVALAVLGYLVYARVRFAHLLKGVHVHADRRAPDTVVHQDEPATLRATLVVGPPGLRVTVDDDTTGDAVVESTTATPTASARDGATYAVATRVRPLHRGPHRSDGFMVKLEDPDGLFGETFRVAAPLEYTVHAPRSAYREGRSVRDLRAIVVPRRSDPGEWSEEVLAHRPYEPGDRPRDIDWKVSSRFEELLTRTFLREVERPFVLLLDASRTMRHQSAGPPMLDDGARFVTFLVGAAWRQGSAVGFGACDEYRVLHIVKPSRDGQVPRLIDRDLALLPAPIPIPAEGAAHMARLQTPEPEARGRGSPFEAAIAPFLGGRGTRAPHGVTQMLRLLAPQGAPRTLVLFSDLQHRTGETIAALVAARQHQHRVIVASPFAPWYHARDVPVTAERLEAVHAAWLRRRRAVLRLQASGIEVMDVAPDTEGRDIVRTLQGETVAA